ncbi:MAG: hypothetical protein OEZ32_06155 [Nitrospinota bacterium]|nr:hypothetical protein [Nitrospinota bacterium]
MMKMTRDTTTLSRALNRITNLLSNVVSAPATPEVQISGVILRNSDQNEGPGLEALLPDGTILTVKDDEVGRAIRRVQSLFAGRRLKVTCTMDHAARTIKMIKVETQHNSNNSSKTWLASA